QIDARRVEEADVKALIGQTLRVLVTDIRDGGKNVVVSRRALLAREASEVAQRAMSDIVPGAVLRGQVTSVRDFGAFVDLGGVEGLLHVSELGRGDKAADGEEVRVVVKKIDRASRKISLALAPEGAEVGSTVVTNAAVKVNAVVTGVVERIETYGLFVQIDGT